MLSIIPLRNSIHLAKRVAEILEYPLLTPCVRRFNNGEMSVAFRDRVDSAVVIAQTESDSDWIELFLLLDALRNARSLPLCLTYMGYSRQDQQNPNESMATRMFANILETFNISRCIIIDNHSDPMLRIPMEHMSARSLFEQDIRDRYGAVAAADSESEKSRLMQTSVVVSPDLGGVRRAYEMSRSLKCDFIICNKSKNVFGELKKVDPIGSVEGKLCILLDDMIDSGATICHAAASLMKAGARDVVAYCTHGIFSKGCLDRVEDSPISELVVTDTIQKECKLPSKIRKISVDSLIADAIKCIL